MNCMCFKILDIFKVKRKSESLFTAPRPWTSIAFRSFGESVFTVNEEIYHAGPYSMLYLPSNISFYRQSTDEEMIILHLKCYEEEGDIQIFHPDNIPHFAARFQELYAQWEEKGPGYEHRCQAILHTLLADLTVSIGPAPASYKANLISPGVHYLDTRFTDPDITVKRLADTCSISEEYFRRIYKEIYGISPCKAMVHKRIQKACSLLQSGYFSVEEVATQTGFQNCKYFSTLFHKVMKVSPREYKKACSLHTQTF